MIYISGPISGRDLTERKETFAATAAKLEAMGFGVCNPMENGLPPESTTHEHMRRDIYMLMRCDCIYMMKGWTHSKGCQVELEVATAIGLPVMFEEFNSIVKFE